MVGIENDMRATFFGPEASTREVSEALRRDFEDFREEELDIRDSEGVAKVFQDIPGGPDLIIHTAGQPSHDWAARDPFTDFGVNANGTLNLLEATRAVSCPTRRSSSARPTRSTATCRTACRLRMTSPVEAIGRLLQGRDNARTSVAIFRDPDPRVSKFTVYVGGLSGETKTVPNPKYDPKHTAEKKAGDKNGNETPDDNPEFFILHKTLAMPYALPGDLKTRRSATPKPGPITWVMR